MSPPTTSAIASATRSARSLSRGSTRRTPPAGTEVAATGRTIARARALRRKAGVRISAVPSSSSLVLAPKSSHTSRAIELLAPCAEPPRLRRARLRRDSSSAWCSRRQSMTDTERVSAMSPAKPPGPGISPAASWSQCHHSQAHLIPGINSTPVPSRTYTRSSLQLPIVDVPDWVLVRQIAELLWQYARGGETPDFRAIEVRDERGVYSDTDVNELRAELAARAEPAAAIEVRVQGWESDAGAHRVLSVKMYKDRSSEAMFISSDEAIVVHCYERTNALMEQAAARRGHTATPTSAPAADRPHTEADSPASHSTALRGWHKWVSDPNPWVLGIVTGVIVAIIAAVIAIILH